MSDKLDVLIVSDTHGRVDKLDRLIECRQRLLKRGEVLNVIFLGDGLSDLFSCSRYDNIIAHAVRGNCDYSVPFGPYGEDIPTESTIELCGHKIFIAHGHTLDVKFTRARLYQRAAEVGADIALFGHTHSPLEEYITNERVSTLEKPLAVFNPGSLGFGSTFGNISLSREAFLLSHGTIDNLK
ncbi:MAG: YfcE family phosphodiesterase [Clostridia bacterium]|nr:YfcE family phosphodiesterase [Clostridia bacterium]